MRFAVAVKAVFALLLTIGALGVRAQDYPVYSDLASLGGGQWRYDFSLSIHPTSMDEVTIYFGATAFANLAVSSTPLGWDALTVQPDLNIPAVGFVDILRIAGPLPSGHGVNWSVSFDYFGTGSPGSLSFELIDSASFTVLYAGSTTAVPEPPPLLLMLVAVPLLARVLHRRRNQAAFV